MRHGIEAYLAEFVGELTEAPSRFAATPSYSAPATRAAAATVNRTAERLVQMRVLPDLFGPGVNIFNVPVVTFALVLNTPDAWTSAMTSARAEVEAILAEGAARRRAGRLKRAREERPDAHILNNYSWTEYPIPANGDCAPANLVWLDLWFRCKAVLARLAYDPPSGTSGVAIAQWVQDVRDAVAMLYDAANIRQSCAWGQGPDSNPYAPGLASINQTRGIYTPLRMTSGTELTPKPTGGWQELLGRDIPQTPAGWACSETRFNPYGPPCLAPTALTAADPYQQRWVPYAYGMGTDTHRQYNNTPAGSFGTWAPLTNLDRLMRSFWSRGGRDPVVGPGYGSGVTITHYVRETIDATRSTAAFFADPLLSYPAVLLRSAGFYQRTYLKVWADRGVLPRDIADTARAAWESATASERGLVTGVVGSAGGAVTAIATAINPIAGAVVGAAVLVASLITQFSDAISAPDREVPEPFAMRFYAGTCNDAAWAPSPPPLVSAPLTTRPTSTLVTPPPPPPVEEDERDLSKGPAGLVIGVGALSFGLWLLSRSSR